MGIKQFHLVCTFIIWCLFSSWSECSEKSLGTVVILPLIHTSSLSLTFSLLKQLILDQTKQDWYQTVPFSVYIHNLMFGFTLEWVLWKGCRYSVVNLPLMSIGYLYKVLIYLTKVDKYGHETDPFTVYIYSLIFWGRNVFDFLIFVISLITKMIYCVKMFQLTREFYREIRTYVCCIHCETASWISNFNCFFGGGANRLKMNGIRAYVPNVRRFWRIPCGRD